MQQNMLDQSYLHWKTSWYMHIPDKYFVNNHLVITLTILGLNRIYLWVSLGSATQISLFVVGNILPFIGCCSLSQKLLNYFTLFFWLKMIIFSFQIPLCVIVGWIMGVSMDLDFGRLQSAPLLLQLFWHPWRYRFTQIQNTLFHHASIKNMSLTCIYIKLIEWVLYCIIQNSAIGWCKEASSYETLPHNIYVSDINRMGLRIT